jgi:hypothetical protein
MNNNNCNNYRNFLFDLSNFHFVFYLFMFVVLNLNIWFALNYNSYTLNIEKKLHTLNKLTTTKNAKFLIIYILFILLLLLLLLKRNIFSYYYDNYRNII